jgi:voltage-gated potassium channel Kch
MPRGLWVLIPLLLQPVDRSRLPAPPARIFGDMLRFAEEGDLERVRRSLDVLAPLLAEHERALGTTERAETTALVRSGDRAEALRGVRRLVARDIIVLLRSMESASPDRMRTLLLTAGVEWRLVEPAVAREDVRSAQAISARFRDLSSAIGEKDMEGAGALVRGVENDLRTALR